jgi:hypothetical protein
MPPWVWCERRPETACVSRWIHVHSQGTAWQPAAGDRLAPWRTYWRPPFSRLGRLPCWHTGAAGARNVLRLVNSAAICPGRRLPDTGVLNPFVPTAAQCSFSAPRHRRLREAACLASLVTSHASQLVDVSSRHPHTTPLFIGGGDHPSTHSCFSTAGPIRCTRALRQRAVSHEGSPLPYQLDASVFRHF